MMRGKYWQRWWWVVVVSAGISFAGCKDENSPLDGDSPSNVLFPGSDVSYGRHVQPLFNQACALAGCHDDGTHQSALKLTSYGSTVYMLPGIVLPGNPDQSMLVLRVQGTLARMPPYGPALNDNQVNGIRAWIAEGAKNN